MKTGSTVTETIARILLATAAVCALLLTVRAFAGPYAFLVAVNSPLNLASIFGLAFTLSLLLRSRSIKPRVDGRSPSRTGAIALLALVIATAVAFFRSLSFSFTSDDFVLLSHASWFHWSGDLLTRGGGDGFFRPIGHIALGLNMLPGTTSPLMWHLPGLLLHLGSTALLYVFAWRIGLTRWGSVTAAGIFALHGTRPEAVAWLAGRYDLLATFWVFAGLIFFTSWQRTASRWALAGSLACELLAILSKESAYVFPALVLMTALMSRSSVRTAVRAMLPSAVLAAMCFAYRWSLFGGIGGYRNPATGAPEAVSIGALGIVKALALRLWAQLYIPINWSEQPGLLLALSMALCLGLLLFCAHATPDGSKLAFGAAFTIACALPPVHQLLIGADLEKSRVLYLPAAGFGILIGAFFGAVPRLKLRAAAICSVLLFQTVALQHNLSIWGRISALTLRTCDVVASEASSGSRRVRITALPASIDGVYFFRNGLPECIRMRAAGGDVELAPATYGKPNEAGTLELMWDRATRELRPVNGAGGT